LIQIKQVDATEGLGRLRSSRLKDNVQPLLVLAKSRPFYDSSPGCCFAKLQRAMKKQAGIDGSMVYLDRKWSIIKDKTIPPESKWE